MELKLSRKLETKRIISKKPVTTKRFELKSFVLGLLRRPTEASTTSAWNFLIVFALFFIMFGILAWQLVNLQVINGKELLAQSETNQVKVDTIAANRGVVFDRNGVKLVENIASSKLYLSIEPYEDAGNSLNNELLAKTSDTLWGILGESWAKTSKDNTITYSSIMEKVLKVYADSPYFTSILIANDLSNDTIIRIKAASEDLPGVYIDDGSKRSYPFKDAISAVLGYTGEATSDDIKNLSYVNATDIVGRTGLERQYDETLAGEDGKIAWEVDSQGRKVSNNGLVLSEPVSGENLYLTIDMDVQNKLYELLKAGVEETGSAGGAGVIEDVNTGEIIAMVTYPTYDNNLFIGGISVKDYASLINNKSNPLLNRAIGAQEPPGSTFKTIVATGALDTGTITKDTKYTSISNYKFSNGAHFPEYMNHSYGVLNVIDALSVSSNIFFCETIRHWNIDALVPYMQKFGIGQTTGIDLPGEAKGRLPSPANKFLLATTTSPWLDPVWYPEGDSCNSVIGQGITLVTPLQMANWVAAIANEGTLYQPHIAQYFVDENGNKTEIPTVVLQKNIAGKAAFDVVKEGMWSVVNGSRAFIPQLGNLGVEVAAKTGTAEFGALDKNGNYTHTHAWTTGFFPYDNPKYSFTLFLEDGGLSLNATKIAKEMISWMVKAGKI